MSTNLSYGQGGPYRSEDVSSGSQQQGGPQNDKVNKIKQDLDDTRAVLQSNFQSLGERGENLDTLQNKTGTLAESAQGFRRGANRVRKQMWWKDMKMRMCLIAGIIILLLIIIIPSVVATRK